MAGHGVKRGGYVKPNNHSSNPSAKHNSSQKSNFSQGQGGRNENYGINRYFSSSNTIRSPYFKPQAGENAFSSDPAGDTQPGTYQTQPTQIINGPGANPKSFLEAVPSSPPGTDVEVIASSPFRSQPAVAMQKPVSHLMAPRGTDFKAPARARAHRPAMPARTGALEVYSISSSEDDDEEKRPSFSGSGLFDRRKSQIDKLIKIHGLSKTRDYNYYLKAIVNFGNDLYLTAKHLHHPKVDEPGMK
jgi:hypothetical protein